MAFFGCSFIFSSSAQVDKKDFVLGEVLTLDSKVLGENRTINIYQSPDALEGEEYQVIYLLDGAENEDFIHVVGLVQFGTFPWVGLLPPTIVVGIANTDRRGQMTFPTKHEKYKADFPTAGNSAKFIQFIESELQPYIESNYTTSQDKIIIGQSLAGLFATEILYKHPELFTHYIIVSPSLWWDEQSLLATKPSFAAIANDPPKVFVAVGEEGDEMISVAKALVKQLEIEKLSPHFYFMGDQNHANIHHLAVYKAFEILFQQKPKE